MNLVSDWRDAWRWVSVHAMLLAIVVQGSWQAIGEDLRASLPPSWERGLTVALLVLGIVGRLVDQNKPEVIKAGGTTVD